MIKVFMMIKPDAIKRGLVSDIVEELTRFGCIIESFDLKQPDIEEIYKHYESVINRMDDQEKFMIKINHSFKDQTVIPMIVATDKTIQELRDYIGSTQPTKASKHTIRKKYGLNDSFELADLENRMVNNLIHCSDSIEASQREIKLWFKKDL